nr:hypothetical protein GCM10020093_025330 [Planobispora longispora]
MVAPDRRGGLLRTTDTPIGEVASRIGYTSEFAFANAFKRHYGTAPGKYRRQNITSPVREGGPLGNAGTDV